MELFMSKLEMQITYNRYVLDCKGNKIGFAVVRFRFTYTYLNTEI